MIWQVSLLNQAAAPAGRGSGADASRATGRIPLADEGLHAAALAIAADRRAAVRKYLAGHLVHRLGARAPGLLGPLPAVAQRRRNAVALLLGAAVADDDLVADRP